jgi:hypothetical protein
VTEFFVGLLAAFAVGTLWFWIFLAIVSGIVIYAVEEAASGALATWTAIIAGILLALANGWSTQAIVAHPWLTIGIVLSYFVLGTSYAIIKWWSYVGELRRKLDAVGSSFYVGNTLIGAQEPPQVARHKARILGWMTYWPWSAAWTLVNDPVKRVFRTIYYRIAGRLQQIADRAWRAGV